jgi:hypothetical protein
MPFKDLGIILSLEQATLILSGLDKLPDSDKKKVPYQKLYKDIDNIKTVWERRRKNEKIQETAKPIVRKGERLRTTK